MSRENVKKFYELAETDKKFAQKLASLDSEMSLEASDLANLKDIVNEKIIPLAKEKGLDFTAEEMVEFANEKYMQLSEDDLLEVSGGVSPKTAGLALSSVLLLSLGSAAAINLMNNNHDDVSHVVSEPSKTASEGKDESEDEEALKKSLDEMLKKSPKGADKNANMEDIEKELDKLFKGGKLGGGSAFKPGKGRAAGKNMLNRTIGKKGTSDFDKFLKELGGELAKEAAASQKAKPKAATSEVSDFNFDKFMEEINREKKSETGAARAATSDTTPIEEDAKPAPTATSALIDETTKPAPTSKGTPKKIEKTKEQVEAEKKQAQQNADKRLADFKAKFETSFKEKFKTQCDDEDLKAFVQEYLTTPGNLDDGIPSKEIVEFYYGGARANVNVLDFAKELNAALPKMQYESVSRGITTPWKDIMSHVMGALQNAKYDLSYFDAISLQKLQNDIDWICGKINTDGYLPALGKDYGKNAKSTERKNIELLKALKDASYVANNDRVQTALKALSGDEIKGGEEQARIEREKKEAEEKAKKEKEEQERKQKEEEARKEKEEQERKQKEEEEKERLEQERFKKEAEEVVQDIKEIPVEKPLTQGSNFVFENEDAARQIANQCASTFTSTIEGSFNHNVKTQLSEADLPQLVNKITKEAQSDQNLKNVVSVNDNLVTFTVKGQLKDGTKVEVSQTVNVLELLKEWNAKKPQEEIKEKVVEEPNAGAKVTTAQELTGAVEEIKDEIEENEVSEINAGATVTTAKEMTEAVEEKKEKVVEKPNAGANVTTAQELTGAVEEKKDETTNPQDDIEENEVSGINADGVSLSKANATTIVSAYTRFSRATAAQQTVHLVNFLNRLGNVENLKFVDQKDRRLLAQDLKHIHDQIKTDQFGKLFLKGIYNKRVGADYLKIVRQAFEIVKDDSVLQEELVVNPVEKPAAGAKVTTTKELQQQAEMQVGLARSALDKKFNEKIAANNGIELNEANLNKMISETLDSYRGKENIDVNEQKGTVTFTAKGVTKSWFVTGDDSCSATLKVREFFTKLNKEATEARRTSERAKFDREKYVTATEADVSDGMDLARKTASEMIREKFEDIIVEKYNAENSAKTVNKISEIPAGKVAHIINLLNFDDVVAKIVKAGLSTTDNFSAKDKGFYFIKTAPENEELKIGAIGYKKTGLLGTSTELIKYGDEISIRGETKRLLEEIKLTDTFNEKIKENNGIELNGVKLDELINQTLDNYSKENENENENVVNVREFFTKLNNEVIEARKEEERSSFDHNYVTATENDVSGGLDLARKTAKEMIKEKFEDIIIVAKYNAENPTKQAISVEDIPAGKVASIVKSLKLDEVVADIVKANIEKTHGFKDKDSDKADYEGSYSIKTAPVNEELKIGAIGYNGFNKSEQPNWIQHNEKISISEEVGKIIKESIEKHTLAYKKITDQNANKEAEALYKFLADNKLVENGTVVESVLDAIKDSDKEHFKKDVKHIAGNISGGEGSYTLSGKWLRYNVAQEKLKAIKDLAGQLGV